MYSKRKILHNRLVPSGKLFFQMQEEKWNFPKPWPNRYKRKLFCRIFIYTYPLSGHTHFVSLYIIHLYIWMLNSPHTVHDFQTGIGFSFSRCVIANNKITLCFCTFCVWLFFRLIIDNICNRKKSFFPKPNGITDKKKTILLHKILNAKEKSIRF